MGGKDIGGVSIFLGEQDIAGAVKQSMSFVDEPEPKKLWYKNGTAIAWQLQNKGQE